MKPLLLTVSLVLTPMAAQTAIEEQNLPNAPEEKPEPVLTRAPELLEFFSAAYPADLLAAGTGGEVTMTIDIDATGAVERVTLVSASDPAFVSAALVAATQFKFSPAEIDGVPAAIRIEYRYVFEPRVLVPDAIAGEPSDAREEPITFRGLVREAGNRRPVAGAVLQIDGRPVAETDDEGRFTIRGAPTGAFQVRLSTQYHDAYETTEERAADEALDAKYYLVRTSTNPFEVVVRSRADRREVARVQLQREELRKVPGTFGDPVRVIENLPGTGRAPGGLGGALLVRGERPSASNVYLDGVEIPLLYHFGGLTSVINSEFLENIDFYPGGFGARYGEATAGVVEVHSRDLDCDLMRGSAKVDFIDASAYACVPLDGWYVAAAARRSYVDVFLDAILDATSSDGNGQGSVTASPVYWDYQVKATTVAGDHHLDIFAFGNDDTFKLITTGSAEDINFDFNLHLASHRLLVRDRWRISEHVTLVSQLAPGLQIQDIRQEAQELGSASNFALEVGTVDWREDLTWEIGDAFTLRAGFDHRFGGATFGFEAPFPTDLRRFPSPTFDFTDTQKFDRDLERYHHAYWLELEAEPIDGLRFVPGIRFERWDFHKTQDFSVLPRATVRWEVTDGIFAKAAYGLYEKLPEPRFLIDSIGNPRLDPERAHHFIVGYEHEITELIHLDVQAYYNLRSNIPSSSNTVRYVDGEARAEIWSSTGTGYTYGLEVLLRHLATPGGRFYGWLAYTLSRSVRRDREPGATYFVESPEGIKEYAYSERRSQEYAANFDQTHILTLVAQWVLPWWGLEAGLRFRLVSGNPITPSDQGQVIFDADADAYEVDLGDVPRNSDRMPVFHQLDVRIDKTWTFDVWKLTAYIEIINVYNQSNVEQYQYDYRYDERVPITLYPIVPVLGVRGEF